MSPDRWQQIEALYHAAAQLDTTAREAFLERACAGDEALRHEVESLLTAHEQAGSFIAGKAVAENAQHFPASEDQPTARMPSSYPSINHYRIVSLLGKGGMGEVWLAEDTRLHRKVALKLLPAEFTREHDRVRRFEREARTASALNHPHILTIYETGQQDNRHFIASEFVEGRTLRQVIAQGNLTLPTTLDIITQIASALAAAHEAGIVHRDIKPENVMLRPDGYVKVLDFGLAKLTERRGDGAMGRQGEEADTLLADSPRPPVAGSLTMPGIVMGTVRYMSPEQARGLEVDGRSDIFSLGIMLYEMIAGRVPFEGTTNMDVMAAILNCEPLPLPKHVVPALQPIIQKALCKDCAQRYQSARDLQRELKDLSLEIEFAARQRRSSGTTTPHAEAETILSPNDAPLRCVVGREKERAALHAAVKVANTGRGSLLCVTGEPGIGKSTLVEDFLTELSNAQSCQIARGRCSERLAGTEAYLPLLEALDALCQDHQIAAQMRQLAPTWYAQVASVSEDDLATQKLLAEVKAASQERMKRELGAFLQVVGQTKPLVLFFDDLHWADVSTIDMLAYLAAKFDAMRVLIVATYRPSDMLLSKHPFLQLKPDLQARGLCHELQLAFLTQTEIEQYLAFEFPQHHFTPDFAKLIHTKTEGSPLFMADLVRYLRDRSVIANTSGAWKLEQSLPDLERELPESVRGMIERKIAQLSEEDRKLLNVASVQGYEFDSAVVAQVLNIDADEVEERLEKLERVFAFVTLTSEAEFPNRTLTLKYRFVHVLYQNAMYSSLRVTRKASLCAAVAQSLLEFYGAQSHSVAGELANLFESARDFAKSAEQFAVAAQQAAQVFANAEAITLARRGLQVLQTMPASAERNRHELSLLLTLGLALAATTFWAAPEVGEVHRRAQSLCQQAETPQFFQVLTGLWSHHLIRAEIEAASELARQILRFAEEAQDSFMLELAHCFSGITMHHLGNLSDAEQHFAASLSLYRPGQDLPYHTLMAPSVGAASEWARNLWLQGYPDQSLHQVRQAYELADSQSNPSTLGFALVFTAYIHQLRREDALCEGKAEAVMRLSREKDIADNLLWASCARGWAIAKRGRPEEGLGQLRETTSICKSVGAEIDLTHLLALLAEAYMCARQFAAALATVDEALGMTARNRDCYYDAELQRLRGELLLLNGATEAEAERCFQQALEIARQQSAKSWELRAATSLARLWQQQGKLTEAHQMLAEIYDWFTEGFDTADLQDAKALLEKLQQQTVSSIITTSDNKRHEFNLQIAAVEADTLKRELMTPDATTALKMETPSIAVLPFVNISNDPDNEYFCDGLAEELLNALSKIEALRVAARTSAFSFKGKETDIREIGQKLNVGAVLEGSVRKAGNRLRITAQLINVADGYHLWSERYDREMQDIFDIQDEISLAIVDALKVKLLGEEKAAMTKRYTDNTEAYQLYLLGRYQFGKYSEEGFKKAIAYFEKAIEQEAGYAPAWAALANSYRALWFFGYLPPAESVPQWQDAITKGLAIDQNLAECHISRALLKFFYERDFPEAEKEFKRALHLNPNYAEAHEQYGLFLAALQRRAESIVQLQRALELDPLSLVNNIRVGWSYWTIGQFDELRAQGRKLLELEPNFYGGYWLRGIGLWVEGQLEQATNELEQAVARGGISHLQSMLGCLYGLTKQSDKAQEVLTRLRQHTALQFNLAIVYAGLGDMDRAFAALEESCELREGVLVFLRPFAAVIPGLGDDPRLLDLRRRIGLPQSAR